MLIANALENIAMAFPGSVARKTYTEAHSRVLDSMYISQEKAVLALRLLLEGNSIRSTERITELDRNTIMSLLVKAGDHCNTLLTERIVNVPVQDVEVDEIWGFVGKKEGHKTEQDGAKLGDAYCFIGMERSTKLVLTYHLGKRTAKSTDAFIGKLAYATASDSRFQLTSDGFSPYVSAVKMLLKERVDFAQLIKVYGVARDGEQRYSPAEVVDQSRSRLWEGRFAARFARAISNGRTFRCAWACGA